MFVFFPACVWSNKKNQEERRVRVHTTMCHRVSMIAWSGADKSQRERKVRFDSSLIWVQMTCWLGVDAMKRGVRMCVVMDAGQNSCPLCLCSSGPIRALLCLSHNCQCPAYACTATLALLQKHRKTTAGITSPRHWIKSGLYPQKWRINMRNVNVCAGGEREGEKDILKYTFIQSRCEIKQQNWSALPSTLAPLPPLDSPPHQVLTFDVGHRHDDSSLACCHLSSGQKADCYRIGWFDRLGQRCVWKREQSPIHIHALFFRHKITQCLTGQYSLIKAMNQWFSVIMQ